MINRGARLEKGFVETVGRPFFVAVGIITLETILLSIPSIGELWHEFRWWTIGKSFVPYHFLGSFLLFLFVGLMLSTAMGRSNRINNILFICSIALGGLMFAWSGIVDYLAGGTQKIDHWLHDSVWFPLMAMFVFVFYLHLEFQTNPYPPLKRVVPVIASISPVFIVGIASLLSGEDYIHMGLLSFLSTTLVFLGGMLFTSVFGTVSYYRSLRNYDILEGGVSLDAQIQFASLAGLTIGMILFAVDTALNLPLGVQFPLILVTFMIPLMVIYTRNPNYISVLATPVLELLVVNESGVTVYSYDFLRKDRGMESSTAAYLKGSVISAIFTVFNEIAGKDSNFNEVGLEDRAFLVEKVINNGKVWTVGVIVTASCFYIKQSLHIFTAHLQELIKHYGVSSDGAVEEFPKEIDGIVKEIFT